MNLGKFLMVTSIIVLIALGYIYQQVELVKVSYQINRHEQVLVQLIDQNKILRYNVSYLKAAPHLEKRLMARQVKLSMPQTQAVVHLAEVRPNPIYITLSKTKDAFIGLFAFSSAATK
jgi:hypothetical protein